MEATSWLDYEPSRIRRIKILFNFSREKFGGGPIKLVFFDQKVTDLFIRQAQTHLSLKYW